MDNVQRTPSYVDPNGVPYFKDPSGRFALRGVLGGRWTNLVTDAAHSAIGFDDEGFAMLQDVPAPIWAAGAPPQSPARWRSEQPTRSKGGGARGAAAWSMIFLGGLGLVGGGIYWAWLNGQVGQSALIRQADTTVPGVIIVGVSGLVLFAGIVILVASLPANR